MEEPRVMAAVARGVAVVVAVARGVVVAMAVVVVAMAAMVVSRDVVVLDNIHRLNVHRDRRRKEPYSQCNHPEASVIYK